MSRSSPPHCFCLSPSPIVSYLDHSTSHLAGPHVSAFGPLWFILHRAARGILTTQVSLCSSSAQKPPVTPVSLSVKARVFAVAYRVLPVTPRGLLFSPTFLLPSHWLPCLSLHATATLLPQDLCTGCFLCQ